MTAFSPSRASALSALEAFLPNAGSTYAQNRKFDFGPGKNQFVSQLSPYIRRRLICEREVIEAVLSKHSFSDCNKFLQEVLWRTYWKGWLEMRPTVWQAFKQNKSRASENLRNDSSLKERYDIAVEGRTGIDCFDAWVTELIQFGFLHNHTRMWFASIWIFTLKLPWELGAAFFFRHLLDADPASNTLSWRWVAGLHTIGKHYVAKAENIRNHSPSRFKVKAALDEAALPLVENEKWQTEAIAFPESQKFSNVPLLIHPEHCYPEAFEQMVEPSCILTISDFSDSSSPGERSTESLIFDRTAVLDAAARASKFYSKEHIDLPIKDLGKLQSKKIATSFAPVGDIKDQLFQIFSTLAEQNIEIYFMPDRWDRTFFPLANKGFFNFRKSTLETEQLFRSIIQPQSEVTPNRGSH